MPEITETTQLPARLVSTLKAVKVTPEYQAKIEEALAPYFKTLEDWDNRIKAFKAKKSFTDEDMKKAGEGRKLIQQKRIQAVKVIDDMRAFFQNAMSDYKNADTLCLRAKQNLEADCKTFEAELKEIEEARLREELAAKAKLKAERSAQIADLCSNPDIYPLGEMSEGDFQNLRAVLVDTKNRLLEAEQKMAEIEKEQEEIARNAQAKLREQNELLQRKQERVKSLMRIGLTYDPDPAFNIPFFSYPGGTVIESDVDIMEEVEFDMLCATASTAIKQAKEEEAQKKAAEKAAEDAKANEVQARKDARYKAMYDLGLKWDGEQFCYKDINFHWTDIVTLDDEQWDKAVTGATARMKQLKEEEQAEAKAQHPTEPEILTTTVLALPVTGSMKSRLTAWLEALQFPEPPGEYTGKGLKEVKNMRQGFITWLAYCEERIEKI